jgi:hypothetical protein
MSGGRSVDALYALSSADSQKRHMHAGEISAFCIENSIHLKVAGREGIWRGRGGSDFMLGMRSAI